MIESEGLIRKTGDQMSKIIQLNNKPPDQDEVDVLLCTQSPNGNILTIYKDNQTNSICLCVDCKYDDSNESLEFDDDNEIVLCNDDDAFIEKTIKNATGWEG